MKTAIEILDQYIEESNQFTDPEICQTDEHKLKIAELMNFHTEQFKPKWISVEDGLPLHSGHYIVHKNNGLVLSMFFGMDERWYWGSVDQHAQVTHWTILPQFP